MTDTIFLVHGMGNHQENWADPVITKLKALYNQYPRLSRVPFEQRFKVVPIRYDNIFRARVQQWQQDANALGVMAGGIAPNQVTHLVGWLRNAGNLDNNFAWTHCVDVLLFRFFLTVRKAVSIHVVKQLIDGINALNAGERWSIIAHSLGTAVSHDALDALWTGTLEDGDTTGFEAKHNQALVVCMLANVSRVLQTSPKVYDSTVKPGAAGQAGRGCNYFLNMRHRLDPFTIPKMFDPQQWPDPDSEVKGDYRFLECKHIHQANVHGFEHYLANPMVHIPLFRQLTFDTAITASNEADALAQFKPFGTLGDAAGIALQQKLEALLPAISDDWQRYRDIWDRFHTLLGD